MKRESSIKTSRDCIIMPETYKSKKGHFEKTILDYKNVRAHEPSNKQVINIMNLEQLAI